MTVESWIPGSIVSRADARIASVIPGPVLWIAEVGSRMRQGEPLAREELDVTPGAGVADAVEVRGALAARDRLVIRGGERLVAGQAVRVIDPAPHSAQTHPG